MKKIVLVALLIALSYYGDAKKNGNFFIDYTPTDSIDLVLKSINVHDYIGKPVDSLLRRLPGGAIEKGFVLAMPKENTPKFRFRKYIIKYANFDLVEIEVHEFRYMNPVSPTKTWDFEGFKKEVLHTLTITTDRGSISTTAQME
jgi:hypothetical protein